MNQTEQRQLDSLIRAQEFLSRNSELVGPIASSVPSGQIEEAVSQLRQYVTAQGATSMVVEGQTGRIRGMAQNLVRIHLSPIAKFSRATLRGVPEYATLAVAGEARSPKRLVSHAFAVAAAAHPYRDTMTAAGFPADTIEQLVQATTELNEAIVKREPLAAERVQSTRTIAKLLETGREGVRKVDAVLENRLASNAPALAAWKAASRVQKKVGSVRKPAETQEVTASSAAGAAAE